MRSSCNLLLLLSLGLLLSPPLPLASRGQSAPDPLDAYNVLWTAPSTNSSGSMPLGNGDVGINLWVEQDGDLLFLMSKTDAWDEHARLLKLGRVRVKLSPNPFRRGLAFRQELRLRQAEIQIDAGPANSAVTLNVRVDASDPIIRIEARGEQPFNLEAGLELWRTQERALIAGEESGTDTFAPDLVPVVYPDMVLGSQENRIVWFHRNQRSIWPVTMKHQGLSAFLDQGADPLLNRTFGGLMQGAGLVSHDATHLKSTHSARRFSLDIVAVTAQTDSLSEWVMELERANSSAAELGDIDARGAHRAWWNVFWNRSWIRVSRSQTEARARASEKAAAAESQIVSQGYALQRFMNACAGRGQFPIKFNGSIFTTDVPGRFDPDYRQWGGCYWFQNTRIAYWPMLASGDFDLMQPLFRMYREMLPFAKVRTETYFHHGGAFFPETMHFWGAYHNGELGYGWRREGEPVGRPVNQYIRYYWSGGLELLALMLDYYDFTRDEAFMSHTLFPFASAVLQFYRDHYSRDPSGHLRIVPAQSLETWWQCENPLPEIAGLQFALDRLLALPPGLVSDREHRQWEELRRSLPVIPTRVADGQTLLAPAQEFANRQNMENPELYAIFPFRLFGIGKPGLDLARRTFERRQFKGNRGWQQDDTQMAFLGLASQARAYVTDRFATKHPQSRFPAFWGPNFDWVPDQDHGGNGLMALETMLLQSDGRKILLFPAWPRVWDVEFKLHAPHQTTVEGSYRQGKLERLKVTPSEREKDLVQLEPQ